MAGNYFDEMNFDFQAGPRHELDLMRLLRDFAMFEELGVTQQLPPPASKTAVETLPDVQIAETGKQCPVCLKDHDLQESVKQLPCSHTFHPGCILPWLEKTNTCPLCRHELPTDDETYEAYRREKKRAKEREVDIENLHNSMFS